MQLTAPRLGPEISRRSGCALTTEAQQCNDTQTTQRCQVAGELSTIVASMADRRTGALYRSRETGEN